VKPNRKLGPVNGPTEDSRARWLERRTVILHAIITPAPMLMVASRHAITASAPATLVHVVAGVPGLTVVDDALMDRGCPIPLRCGLGMNRGHFLVSRGLHRRLGGKPAAPQGGTLGLLHGHGLEETLNLIVGPSGLGRRWLRHVAEKHSSGDNVLAGLVED
jgi:hypothetical protein